MSLAISYLNHVTTPTVGYAVRVTGVATGVNALSIDGSVIDPEFTPNGLIVLQCVNTASPSQAVFASWADTTLVISGQTISVDLWCSSGSDTSFVDILVF